MPTEKQQYVLDALRELNEEGINPTVRSLADRLETKKHRTERFSDDEVRGLLERLEADGHVLQEHDAEKNAERYSVRTVGD